MLVTPAWLEKRLLDPNVVVIDLRWDQEGRGRERFEQGHIPGALHCAWTSDIVDQADSRAFMLAPPDRLADVLGGYGIGDDTVVVAYADAGHSGPFRLWWACSVYGHEAQVRVLDGGLDRWLAESRPLSTAHPEPRPRPRRWIPGAERSELLASAGDVLAARDDRETVVVDSRPTPNYRGLTVWSEHGEIEAGPDGLARTPTGPLRAGRIPWARSVPWHELYLGDLTLKPSEQLRTLFAEVGAVPGRRALAYCSVGLSAAALLYALNRAGIEQAALYDAGWDEWGRDPDRPVARG
jgi:thiosulfate/3-mercaptopyruvate sulfurtransferase